MVCFLACDRCAVISASDEQTVSGGPPRVRGKEMIQVKMRTSIPPDGACGHRREVALMTALRITASGRRLVLIGAIVALALLVPAAGRAVQLPVLGFTPSTNGAFDYGTVVVGQTAPQTFTLTNSGGSASASLTIALTGSAAFTKTADTCTPGSLGPGKSCSVTVVYSPTAAGQSDSATLTAKGKKAAAAASLTLTGTGGTLRHIYWGHSPLVPRVGRADVDGQNVNQNFIAIIGPSEPVHVAVDSSHVYWTNFGTDTVGRADLDGQNVNQSFITGANLPLGIAVDSGHIYWTNFGPDTIGRADLDGQNVNQSFITGASSPIGVAVDSGHIYWTNWILNATIGRADLDGQNVNQSFITGATLSEGVAVDSGHVYWSNSEVNGSIGRADLDGQNVNQSFITGLSSPRGVAVDSAHIYWPNGDVNGTIGRADLNGQNVNQSFIIIGGLFQPVAMAVDVG